MGIFGPKLWIEAFDTHACFTGKSIAGTVGIDTKSSLDVLHIDVVLRCRERVSLITLNGSSAYRSGAVWQRSSPKCTVFPSDAVLNKNSSDFSLSQLPPVVEEAEEMWKNPGLQPEMSSNNSKFTRTYTLQKGVHRFPFEFTLPKRYPSSLRIDDENGIVWYLEAKLYRNGVLSIEKQDRIYLEVFNMSKIRWDPSRMHHHLKEHELKVYKPGYAFAKKQKKQNKTSPRTLREVSSVTLHCYVPVDGLVQAPNPLSVSFGLSCSHSALLKVVSIDMSLYRRVYAKADTGRQQEFTKFIPLVSLKEINMGFKEAIAAVNTKLNSKLITAKTCETYRSPLFTISYKLVTEVTVASVENQGKEETIKLSVPVVVHSSMAEIVKEGDSDGDDQLPRYTA